MKAASKTILFTRVTVDKAVHQWPTAVFGNDQRAKTYATMLKMAHDTGNKDLAVKLDANTRLDSEGNLIKGVKFSIKIADYEPTIGEDGPDPFAE